MTEARLKRPILATIICVFELLIFVIQVIGAFLPRYAFGMQDVASGPSALLLSSIGWLSCILAAVAAVTLWQMRRAAFVVLTTRFALGLIWFVVSQLGAAPALRGAPRGSVYLFGILSLAISASIAWYAHDITSPKAA